MNEQHAGSKPQMRERIALYLRILDKAGIKQKEIAKVFKDKYGFNVTEAMLSKAKYNTADYSISYGRLSNLLQGLNTWVNELLESKILGRQVEQWLIEENSSANEVRQYLYTHSQIMDDSSVVRGDFVLSALSKKSAFETIMISLFFYLVVPYLYAFLADTWATPEYAFSESNTMLLGYPVFAMSIPFVIMFYKSIPQAFNVFSQHASDLGRYELFMRKNLLRQLPAISIILLLASFFTVLFLHLNYLYDDKQSFLEIEKGQPSVFFYLNIGLFAVQLFVFLYVLCVFALSTRACYWLSRDAERNCNLLRGKVPVGSVQPFMLITKHLSIWLGCSLIYGISFGTTVSNFSKKHAEVSFWHKIEAMLMYLPFAVYLLLVCIFIYSLYKMVLKEDLTDGFKSFLAIVQTKIV